MELVFVIPVLLLAVILHEVAHAWQARREGDPTAERLGRITLNPIPHIDLFGSILIPALLVVSHTGFIFGWAKPVPVNPANYRDPKWGDVRVSLAGIVTNLGQAVAFTLLGGILAAIGHDGPVWNAAVRMVQYGILINLILAFFNLIPIPPLDGSHVLFHLLPRRWALRYRAFGRYGLIAIMALLFLVPGAFSTLLFPVELAMRAATWFMRLWT